MFDKAQSLSRPYAVVGLSLDDETMRVLGGVCTFCIWKGCE